LQFEKTLKRQLYLVQQVKEASSVAVILANPADPSVQRASSLARKLLKSRPNPPKVYTLAVGKPNPAKLANFQVYFCLHFVSSFLIDALLLGH
jgi:diphthamide biosynthesis enzyme Dph1/Dph2-like protein